MTDNCFEEIEHLFFPIHVGKNEGKPIYHIHESGSRCGFFAMFRKWLEYLYIADIRGYLPYVDAGDDFEYKENVLINNSSNAFEYFFEQPCGIKSEELEDNTVIMSELPHRKMVELVFNGITNNYYFSDLYCEQMAKILSKYIVFNATVDEYVKNESKNLLQGNVKYLGVHFRGTDFRVQYNNHPVFVTEDDYFEKIDKLLDERYDALFLATDDANSLAKFKKRYGNNCIYFDDINRNYNQRSLLFEDGKRELNKYKLGIEVIRDVYALTRCHGLVSGYSQTSLAARIFKLSYGEKYDDCVLINKGIVNNDKEFLISNKKHSLSNSSDNSAKMMQFYRILTKWVGLKQKGEGLAKRLKVRGISKIAVYGMKEMGLLLCNELEGTEVTVEYAIDKNALGVESPVTVLSPNQNLEEVDAIVVTAVYYFEDIKKELSKKINCQILSLEELVEDK